jgi:DNA modification methylase
MVKHSIAEDNKNVLSFFFKGKSIWNKTYPNYYQADKQFITLKNLLRDIKIKSLDIDVTNLQQVKDLSKQFLLELKKYI